MVEMKGSILFAMTFLFYPLLILVIIGIRFVIASLKARNRLFECGSCERLFRHYQVEMHQLSNNMKHDHCPHCKEAVSLYNEDRSISEHTAKCIHPNEILPGMDTHIHCLRIGFLDYYKILSDSRKLGALRDENEKLKAFEAYQEKFKDDLGWMGTIRENQ